MPGAITTDLILIDAAEATTNWVTVGAWGANPAASADIYLEQAAAINARASAASGPTERYAGSLVATASNLDLTISERHLYYWIKCFSLPAMARRAQGGIGISISSDTSPSRVPASGGEPWVGPSNSKNWFVTGKDFEPESGWVCYVIDPAGTSDFLIGSPVMSTVNRAGIRADALLIVGGGAVKPLPVMWDRIAYGSSLIIKDGTAGSPVTFEDIYGVDSLNANQFGILRKASGLYLAAGKLIYGATDQGAVTYFKDVGQVLIWQDFRQATTLYEIKMLGAAGFATTFQLGTFSGGIASGGCTIRGSGLETRRGIAPVIVSGGTGYTAGDILTVVGGTFTAAATLKVITVSSGVITDLKVETMGAYSVPPTGTLTLTGGTGSSATCTLTFVGGSIWTLTAGAANTLCKLYGCTFSQLKAAALRSDSDVRFCTFQDFGTITPAGGLLDNCTFLDLRTTTPISALYAVVVETVVATITNCLFINCATAVKWNFDAETSGKLDGSSFVSGGTGHGIELGPNCPITISFNSVGFSGYGGTPGSNPTESSGSADAAIFNDSGKTITINVSGGDTPSVRNGAGATTVVVSTVTVTFTGMKDNTEVRVYKQSDGSEVAGIENATDGTADNRSFAWSASPSLVVNYVIHSVAYETIRVNGFTVPAASGSLPIQQRIDRNYTNPG